jgi:outer membrane protein assembly factor BamB
VSTMESMSAPVLAPVLCAALLLQEPAATSAPGTDWPLFRGDASLRGVAAGALALPLERRWSFEAPKAIVSSPAVADGLLVVGCDDGHVYALDAATGERRWAFDTGDIVEAPPLIAEGRVHVGSSDGVFHTLDLATGASLWKHATEDRILGGANLVHVGEEARVVVGSYDANLYCFAAADGALRWTYATDNYVNGTPAVAGDRIVFGGCDARLHVVSAASGEALARIELGEASHVAGSVALEGERAYLGHYGNAFVCVDLARPEVVWSVTDPRQAFFSSPAVTADRVVFGGRNKKLHCAAKATGELEWTFPTRRKVDGSPVVVGELVVFAAGDGRLYVLDLASGEERWSWDLGSEVVGSVAVAGGCVYVAASDGRVSAFGTAGEKEEGPQ